ncbi:ATP-binding protein [Sphingomonas sp. MMS24-J13]|uniref:sensor histidine kinase n=1 Tax=Sphingomonas sp. MMS24-J13 TaxID=3238686 RepID=UPI00384C6139
MRPRRAMAGAELALLAVWIGVIALTWESVRHDTSPSAPQSALSPIVTALLLVANLVPAMGLMVLVARRIARGRSERSPLGGRGGLHVRLVALFSVLAALPTLLVVIFASLLFQIGVQFWFSDKVRAVLGNADRVAQTYVEEHMRDLGAENVAMAGDIQHALATAPPDDPHWGDYFASQFFYRKLDQAAMIQVAPDGSKHLVWGASLDRRPLDRRLPSLTLLADGKPHVRVLSDHMESAMQFDVRSHTYLWIQRKADPLVLAQVGRANIALGDYSSLIDRSRSLQLRFILALFLISLLIVAVAIWVALTVADRLVRPIGELVGAARRVAGGDLTARVAAPNQHDEVGTLAFAFNRMTRRLSEQTGALESRRALTEAVLSGVSAGVISINRDRQITLTNLSAQALLRSGETSLIGRQLEHVAPALDDLLDAGEREAVVLIEVDGDVRTLAVTVVGAGQGHVLTFDDITQRLADQRRAAWADVARRIAHEIKNPLTPIQLAAERLQRRYGRQIVEESGTFDRLVSTIVRQVGNIRRMIDEFSSFARMPKPQFLRENLIDIAKQALFLHEVAHPAVHFSLDAPDPPPSMVCDRRQIGQAFTNIIKNAVEAVEARVGEGGEGHVAMTIRASDERLCIEVADDGVGLPAERERLTEPYMTTRARGTGLGLAIVHRIVEEHQGTITFLDRPGGGTIVRIECDRLALDRLVEGVAEDESATEQQPIRVRSA